MNLGKEFGFGYIDSIGQGISMLIMPFFSIMIVFVIVYFLWGAIKFLTSAGDKGEVEGAQRMITHAIIGFILLILVFLIMQFIPQFFGLEGSNIIQ